MIQIHKINLLHSVGSCSSGQDLRLLFGHFVDAANFGDVDEVCAMLIIFEMFIFE